MLNVLYYFMTEVGDHIPCAEGAVQFYDWGGGPLPMCSRCRTILRLGEDDDGDAGDNDGRIFPEHPSPILHAPRDNISRKGKSLTPIWNT